MAKLKLFSGMDFSGKSTVVRLINAALPNKFQINHNFLSHELNDIQRVSRLKIWPSDDEWWLMVFKVLAKDSNTIINAPILQDTLWGIKYLARQEVNFNSQHLSKLSKLKKIIQNYPSADSFYLTTSMDERLKRFSIRQKSGTKITGSDKLILDPDKFLNTEKKYQELIRLIFPNTIIIDTTFYTPNETAKIIMETTEFQKNI